MASSYLKVGSKGLITLKDDLIKLSQTLHELYELMNADMRNLSQEWRDGKYEEFVSGYRPQINKCEEISQRYEDWCKRVLQPAIEKCIAIETTDVGGDGGATTTAGITSTGGQESVPHKRSKVDAFNLGIKKVKEKMASKATSTTGPQGSGFSTPQNERPYLSPLQIEMLLNGKQR